MESLVSTLTYFGMLLYALAIWLPWAQVRAVCSIAAFFAHTVLLYWWIDSGSGQNLADVHLISNAAWGALLFAWWLNYRRSMPGLVRGCKMFAMLSIAVVVFFPDEHRFSLNEHPKELLHILMVIVVLSQTIVTTLLALMLVCQRWLLKQTRTKYHLSVPLERVEMLFISMSELTCLMLGFVLMMSLYLFSEMMHQALFYKLMLSISAWCCFLMVWLGYEYLRWSVSRLLVFALCGCSLLLWVSFMAMQ